MIGSVFVQLQAYITSCRGKDSWIELLKSAGFPADKVYRTVRFYPDTEFDKLLNIALQITGEPRDIFLRQLGRYSGDYILRTYKPVLSPSWKTLDVMEKVGAKIYRSFQFIDVNAPASIFICERKSPDELILHYDSPRKMCHHILGIIDAIAEHFGEKVIDIHTKCMNNCPEALECTITLKLVRSPKPQTIGP